MKYAKERKAFGEPIGSLYAIQVGPSLNRMCNEMPRWYHLIELRRAKADVCDVQMLPRTAPKNFRCCIKKPLTEVLNRSD